ncbi:MULTISPECIES: DMT family transporter [unclassified Nocardiopsis]|uniref:DMT family transporter n=1 Tax=unclassified Nocardiopsis TaxID=2649073 RepID=UPI001F317542|nr:MULTISPECIES: DMT family transporter [unclassified Nocardiopsis]
MGASTAEAGRASLLGVVLCLVAALTYALGVVAQKPALRHANALQVAAFGCLVGALACLPFTATLVREIAQAPPAATLNLLYLGAFPTAIAFTTWGYALARMPAGRLGATTYLVPVLVALLSWALLGEVPHPLALAGGALCLAGVAISRRHTTTPPAPAPAQPSTRWPRARPVPQATPQGVPAPPPTPPTRSNAHRPRPRLNHPENPGPDPGRL